MDNATPLPPSLKVVALLFIFFGVISLIEVLVHFLTGSGLAHAGGVLYIFIGSGILRLSRGWRTCALVFQWLAMIGTPVGAIRLMVSSEPYYIGLFWQSFGPVPKEVGVVIAALLFVLEVWMYRVLTRPDVRRLFGVGVRVSGPDRVMG